MPTFRRFLSLMVGFAALMTARPVHAQDAPQEVLKAKSLLIRPVAESPSYAKRALVIGIDDYRFVDKLNVWRQDARAIAGVLGTRFGFPPEAITLMTDAPGLPDEEKPTFTSMIAAVNSLVQGCGPNSEVVVYFSGHGVRLKDDDYWVPLDGQPDAISQTCISYGDLKRRLETRGARRVLFLVDACRTLGGKDITSSGFGAGAASNRIEFAEMLSCKPTEVSWPGRPDDFSGSVFTHFLIRGLAGDPEAAAPNTDQITFDSLSQYVSGKVSQYAASRLRKTQNPDGRASFGDMVLAKLPAPPPPVPVVVPVNPIAPAMPTLPGRIEQPIVPARPVTPEANPPMEVPLPLGPAPKLKTRSARDYVGLKSWSSLRAPGRLIALAWSPDGSTVAGAGPDGVYLWSKDGSILAALKVEAKDGDLGRNATPFRSVAFSPDGRLLAAFGMGGAVWDWRAQRLVWSLSTKDSSINCIAFSPDSLTLATGGSDRLIRLYDSETGTLKRTLGHHLVSIQGIHAFADGSLLTLASNRPGRNSQDLWWATSEGSDAATHTEISVWNSQGTVLESYDYSNARLIGPFAMSPDGTKISCNFSDDVEQRQYAGAFWNLKTKSPQIAYQRSKFGFPEDLFISAFAPDSQSIISTTSGRDLKAFDGRSFLALTDSNAIADFTSRRYITCLAFNPTGDGLVTGTLGQTLTFWRLP